MKPPKGLYRAIIAGSIFFMLNAAPSQALEDWIPEFQRLCGATGNAAELTTVELKQLAADSSLLLDKLSKPSQGRVKVYVFRLKKCRDFYLYLLETKNAAPLESSTVPR